MKALLALVEMLPHKRGRKRTLEFLDDSASSGNAHESGIVLGEGLFRLISVSTNMHLTWPNVNCINIIIVASA